MTTSIIKEQIFGIIRQRYFPHEYKLVASNVDEIINLFSKLIDEKIKDIEDKKRYEPSIRNERDFQIIILEELKKELRKMTTDFDEDVQFLTMCLDCGDIGWCIDVCHGSICKKCYDTKLRHREKKEELKK